MKNTRTIIYQNRTIIYQNTFLEVYGNLEDSQIRCNRDVGQPTYYGYINVLPIRYKVKALIRRPRNRHSLTFEESYTPSLDELLERVRRELGQGIAGIIRQSSGFYNAKTRQRSQIWVPYRLN